MEQITMEDNNKAQKTSRISTS